MSRYLILISPAFLSSTSFPVQIARPAKRRRCEYPHMYNRVTINSGGNDLDLDMLFYYRLSSFHGNNQFSEWITPPE